LSSTAFAGASGLCYNDDVPEQVHLAGIELKTTSHKKQDNQGGFSVVPFMLTTRISTIQDRPLAKTAKALCD
jgi:hypothetical protein